ncbi:MAG: MptD family putative ECF transporter S component [Clostridiaceae bacterium]|jgi:energy-coupling factor transport system substrate-specific component|nr:MptD family putative ECF transporter S component [Clostridiaceae bacterium]
MTKVTFKAFTIRDIVFLAVITAVTLLFSGPFAPLVMTATKLGVQAIAMALPFSLMTSVGLRKVKKPGSLTLIGLFSGLVLLLMAPVMFFNQLIGALLSEGTALLLFKTYDNKKTILFSSGLFSFFTIPLTAIVNILAKGRSIEEQIGNPLTFVLIVAGTIILGFAGAFIGNKIADELEKAGKL